MTDNDPSDDDVPVHACIATYEARLIRLERELPSFEHELRRVEAQSAATTLLCRDLS